MTTSSLIGMAFGLTVSKALDISSIYTIGPLFGTLTIINFFCSYMATSIVDEPNFNKQRFYVLYKEFMKSNKILDVKEVNKREVFWTPSLLNSQNELFTTFSAVSLTDKINDLKIQGKHSEADHLISQSMNKERNFTYHIEWVKQRKTIIPKKWSNRREYTINFNLHKDATNEQVLKAYFFSLRLDEILDEKLDKNM